MMSTPGPMTAKELIRLPRGRARHELVRGELRTMPLLEVPEGSAISELLLSLGTYTEAHGLGGAVPSVGFHLARDPDTVRGPSLAFIRHERVEAIGWGPGYWPEAPDLAVEVYTPSDLYSHVADRVADYLEHGTRLVMVVDARRRTVAAHRPGQNVHVYAGDDVLDAEGVVPGWRLPLRELFS